MCRPIFRLIIVLSVFWFSAGANAAEGYRYHSGYLNLTGSGNRIYLFKNISKYPVIIDRHLLYNPGVQAGWASEIDPGKWSAIIISASSFAISCEVKHSGGQYQRASCEPILNVWPIKRFTQKKRGAGGYWIAENLSCKAIQKRIKSRGFYFNFPPCS